MSMFKKIVFATLISVSALGASAQKRSYEEKVKQYIAQYSAWAIEEQQRVGIPAAITLAQGIYETSAGESELAVMANNHFGIKCKKEWTGETFAHTDDRPDECFRKYQSAKASYIDHSDYLKNSPRYARLWSYKKTDYKSWSTGLKACGYATNPQYAQKLITLIENFDLQLYTFAAEGQRQNEVVPMTEPVASPVKAAMDSDPMLSSEKNVTPSETRDDGSVLHNGLRAIYCQKGEHLLQKAMKFNIRYPRLLEINELPDAPLPRDMFVYLEPKNNKGVHATHLVQDGETIEMIAQDEGMTARQLRSLNLMAPNDQAESGALLQMQVPATQKPSVYRIVNGEMVKVSGMPAQLVPSGATNSSDFIPTKKTDASSEEFEFGMGAVPPPQVAEKAPEQPLAPAISKQVPTTRVAAKREGTPALTEAAKKEQLRSEAKIQAPEVKMPDAGTINPATGKPYLESEWRAENDRGALPASLDEETKPTAKKPLNQTITQVAAPEPEAADEISRLKARLDQSVYSRSSRSNIKVSSSDSAAVYNAPAKQQTTIVSSNSATAELAAANAAYHTVKTGETAYSIAKQYGISVKQLNELNGLDFQGIKVGQKLRVK